MCLRDELKTQILKRRFSRLLAKKRRILNLFFVLFLARTLRTVASTASRLAANEKWSERDADDWRRRKPNAGEPKPNVLKMNIVLKRFFYIDANIKNVEEGGYFKVALFYLTGVCIDLAVYSTDTGTSEAFFIR